jgi:hypothetical protein
MVRMGGWSGVGICRVSIIHFECAVRSMGEEASNGLKGMSDGCGCISDANNHNRLSPGYP